MIKIIAQIMKQFQRIRLVLADQHQGSRAGCTMVLARVMPIEQNCR